MNTITLKCDPKCIQLFFPIVLVKIKGNQILSSPVKAENINKITICNYKYKQVVLKKVYLAVYAAQINQLL